MSSPATVLVVAATARELASPAGWVGITCGVGPVEAAITTTRAILAHRPQVVVQVGIAGARRRLGLQPGSLVIGTHSVYADLGDLPAEWATRAIEAPAVLRHALSHALRRDFSTVQELPIGTSARVGGTRHDDAGGEVEAMEGFAVLRAAQLAGIPAIEVRAVSNDIEETDRSRWHFATAFAAITAATPVIVRAVHDALTPSAGTSPVPDQTSNHA